MRHCINFFPIHQYILLSPVNDIHSLIPENHSHTGAGLTISLFIWQIIIFSKTFITSCRTNTTSDIHIPIHHIFPNILHRFHIIHITRLCSHICSTSIHIHCTNRMTCNLCLIFHRQYILCISSVFPICPCITFANFFPRSLR